MRFIHVLMICLIASVSQTARANARTPPPPQVEENNIEQPTGKKSDDFDGDKFWVHDKNPNWRDCDNRDSAVHPYAWETAGDGKVQDCRRDRDLQRPSKDMIKAFSCNPENERAVDVLALEIERCDIDTHCQVLMRKGIFDMSHGWLFADWPDENNKCDGIREVLEPEKAKQVIASRGDKSEQFSYCPTSRPRNVSSGTGAKKPTASAVPATAPTDEVVINPVDLQQDLVTVQLQEELAKTKADLDLAIADSAKEKSDQDALESSFITFVEEQNVTDEAQDQKLGSLVTDVSTAVDNAQDALNVANGQKDILEKLTERSVLAEFTLGGLAAFQAPITLTDAEGKTLGVARGTVAPGLAIGMNLGYDGPAIRLNGFGKIALVGDQVDGTFESGNVKQVGGEVLLRFGRNIILGPHLVVHRHLSGGDVVERSAVSEGIGIGPSFGWASDREENFLSSGIMVRLTLGREALGTKGENIEKTTGFAPVILLSVDVFGGVGRFGSNN